MELTAEEQAILAHVVVDPVEWANRAENELGEWAVRAKIEKYRQEYLDVKDLPGYQTRAEREAIPPLTLTETISLRKQQINSDCQNGILARFPLIHQLDVANGLYSDNGMKQWIADMIAESNRCHDLIDTLTIVEDVMGVDPVWPEYAEVV